jgi:Fe-S cluster biogenesis protein NfuA
MNMPFSDEELFSAIKTLIGDKISPMLARDGGAIELLKVESPVVYVQLQGACIGCASSGSTLKFVVEKEIRSFIHPELVVENVPVKLDD